MEDKLAYQLSVDGGNRRRERDNSWRFQCQPFVRANPHQHSVDMPVCLLWTVVYTVCNMFKALYWYLRSNIEQGPKSKQIFSNRVSYFPGFHSVSSTPWLNNLQSWKISVLALWWLQLVLNTRPTWLTSERQNQHLSLLSLRLHSQQWFNTFLSLIMLLIVIQWRIQGSFRKFWKKYAQK